MERNGHSCLTDSLKGKYVRSFSYPFLSVCVFYVFYIYLTNNMCMYVLSYKYTTYRLLDWKTTLEVIQLRFLESLWIHDDPA